MKTETFLSRITFQLRKLAALAGLLGIASLLAHAAGAQQHIHGGGGGGGGGGSLMAEQAVPVCLLSVGPYKINFAGYLPDSAAEDTFCGDVPGEGRIILVADAIERELRKMQVEFRILSDVKNLGKGATYEQLGTPAEIEAATVFLRPAQDYAQGTVNIESSLTKGHYIALITLHDPATNQTYRTLLPFTAGLTMSSHTATTLVGATALIGLLAGFAYFAFFRHQKAAKTAA